DHAGTSSRCSATGIEAARPRNRTTICQPGRSRACATGRFARSGRSFWGGEDAVKQSMLCFRLDGLSIEFINQKTHADQEDPERKSYKEPRKIGAGEEKKQGKPKTDKRGPAGRDGGVDHDSRRRNHEHRGHLYHVDIHDVVSQCASEMKNCGVHRRVWSGKRKDDCAHRRRRGEEHSQEQQTASKEDRRKKAIFKRA